MAVTLRKIQNYAEYIPLRIILFFILLLPVSFAQKIGDKLASFFYYFIPYRKKHVIKELTLSFPEKSQKDIQTIAKNVYKTFFGMIVDVVFFSKMPDEKIKNMMTYDKTIIANAFAKGRGVVLMPAHMGSWEWTALSFSKDYPINITVTKQKNELFDKMLNESRMNKGYTNIYKIYKTPMMFRDCLNALKLNQSVSILSDQDAGRNGMFVPFFGRPASMPRGAALLALKAQCPIISVFGIRQKDGHMNMEIHDIPLPNTGNKEEDIRIINTTYSHQLEDVVRRHPEQWFWFHRKWKTQQMVRG
ncbi:lysophospholipid acyltransferase family protein [Endomicrobium proavitum]|uniref:Lipid A biosynthesis acyltransferase n=1 Tax=Endomicrobium proavitum TaxID=1408281 RepID=A0A0G3WIH8_9BACT|nr:lysophospholipid acyltransferase family protein [Endomicrobium proavitum]AKL97695.1 lipid A biosynthesis acyltransferase [Endomicrobium proavitum]